MTMKILVPHDYIGLSSTDVSLNQGSTLRCLNITITSDDSLEEDERFLISFGIVDSSARIVGKNSVEVTILNDDSKYAQTDENAIVFIALVKYNNSDYHKQIVIMKHHSSVMNWNIIFLMRSLTIQGVINNFRYPMELISWSRLLRFVISSVLFY